MTSASLLPPRVKFAYGIGSIAYGVKEQGFAYFLLMFYGTVVGLEPALAGTALLIALLTDAISDPIVGYWSDNIHTRWGRRHPFMYASAIPVSLCYFLIWQPPDWSEQALFFYLLALAILIRTLITFFETPSSALMPELTSDYDERTAIQAWRHFFGWFGGASLTILMFAALLVPTAEYEVGTLNRQGYETYGVIAGVAIFIAIIVSSIGTQHAIKLKQPARREPSAERRSKRLTDIFAELKETLFDPSFFALFVSSMAGAVATGSLGGADIYHDVVLLAALKPSDVFVDVHGSCGGHSRPFSGSSGCATPRQASRSALLWRSCVCNPAGTGYPSVARHLPRQWRPIIVPSAPCIQHS